MEITILLCLAAAYMLTVVLTRFHDGDGYYLYHAKNTFGLQQGKSKVFLLHYQLKTLTGDQSFLGIYGKHTFMKRIPFNVSIICDICHVIIAMTTKCSLTSSPCLDKCYNP
jgi:hypothetical protein